MKHHLNLRPIKAATQSPKQRRRFRRVLIELGRISPCLKASLIASAVALASISPSEGRALGSHSASGSSVGLLGGSYSRSYSVKSPIAGGSRSVTYKEAVSAAGKETSSRTIKTTVNGVSSTEKETSSGASATARKVKVATGSKSGKVTYKTIALPQGLAGYVNKSGVLCDPSSICELN